MQYVIVETLTANNKKNKSWKTSVTVSMGFKYTVYQCVMIFWCWQMFWKLGQDNTLIGVFMIKYHHFLRFFLRIWSICCMLARQINLNNMEKEEPIIRRVYRKSLNYGATVVSVVSYAFVTVVPPRISRSFHGHCHTRSMVMERPCPPRWNKCVNTCCHNCSKG